MKKSEVKNLLPQTGKYTIVKGSGMGYLTFEKINMQAWFFKPYAQYDDAMRVVYKRKGGRKLMITELHNYGRSDMGLNFVILKGWVDVETYTETKISESEHATMNQLNFNSIEQVAEAHKDIIAFLPPQRFEHESSEDNNGLTGEYLNNIPNQVELIADIMLEQDDIKASQSLINTFNFYGLSFKQWELQNAICQEYGHNLMARFCKAIYSRPMR